MWNKKLVLTLQFAFLMLSISGCATVSDDYDQASRLDSIQAYEEFLSNHPNSEFELKARTRLEELQEKEKQRQAIIDEENTRRMALLRSYRIGVTTAKQFESDGWVRVRTDTPKDDPFGIPFFGWRAVDPRAAELVRVVFIEGIPITKTGTNFKFATDDPNGAIVYLSGPGDYSVYEFGLGNYTIISDYKLTFRNGILNETKGISEN